MSDGLIIITVCVGWLAVLAATYGLIEAYDRWDRRDRMRQP